MRKAVVAVASVQAVLVLGLAAAVRSKRVPLGVPGEWEWLRLPVLATPSWFGLTFALMGVAAFAGFAAVGMARLTARATVRREADWLAGLLVMAVVAQVLLPQGAPDEYDLTRWAYVPYFPASSGYFRVARAEIRDPWRFLKAYPDWIQRQDALHVGTHPPGLFLVEDGLLRTFRARPGLARWLVDHAPESFRAGVRELRRHELLSVADHATLLLTSLGTVLACAATVVPLYLLARSCLPAPTAWAAAALWPLVPATILFQPVADTAFPFLSTTALALAAWSGRVGPKLGLGLAGASGLVLALGMGFTLAYLPVGLTVGLVLASSPGRSVRSRLGLLVGTGLGWLGLTLLAWAVADANPFAIWWWNQRNHARFYLEFHRTYRFWVVANSIELAIALGLPAVVWGLAGLPRSVPRVAWATLGVLALLNFSGRNLSEVARLWLPLMPPLLTAAAAGLARIGGGPRALAVGLALLGAETIALETAIQVVYPV